MTEELTTINRLNPVRSTLENLRIGKTVDAPRAQRESIKNAIARIKDASAKRYSVATINDYVIRIKRKK